MAIRMMTAAYPPPAIRPTRRVTIFSDIQLSISAGQERAGRFFPGKYGQTFAFRPPTCCSQSNQPMTKDFRAGSGGTGLMEQVPRKLQREPATAHLPEYGFSHASA